MVSEDMNAIGGNSEVEGVVGKYVVLQMNKNEENYLTLARKSN